MTLGSDAPCGAGSGGVNVTSTSFADVRPTFDTINSMVCGAKTSGRSSATMTALVRARSLRTNAINVKIAAKVAAAVAIATNRSQNAEYCSGL